MEFMSVDSEGTARGLLCIWDPEVFQLGACCSSRRFILLSGTMFNSFECVLLNIYASNDVGGRRKLWDSFLNQKQGFPKPLCLCGDFNEVRNIGERKGCSRIERGLTELNEFIENSEVQDLPLLGRKYKRCNSREGVKWSRIDRVLVDPKWLEGFQLKLWGLPRLISDHNPLLLIEDERDWGPKPFRFLNAWCLHPKLSSFVAKVWKESKPNGSAGFILQKKLKDLKLAIRQWNKEVYGSMPNKLKVVEEEVHILDLQVESRELDQQEKVRRRAACEEVWRFHRMMEWTWLQK
ncbi:uncharacterized protein LOC114280720 [Camellia sinensis]|uniref:uncharacterized protein LOC114280720 n=1 Tax=Camellia sinensis TaxID=4442 RepID=UPI0010369360|nr:uncharacterized protein LOC114280720 [Camellia sinensis]